MFCGKTVLEEFAKLGKDIALKADPSHYSFEDRDRALYYQKMLPHLRKAYAQLRNGVDWFRVLPPLRQVITTGIEANFLGRIISLAESIHGGDNR